MKKSLLWVVVLVLSISMVAAFSLAGCKEKVAEEEAVVVEEEEEEEEAAPVEKVKLSYMINFGAGEAITDAVQAAVDAFNAANADIVVELIPSGPDYEALMKAKMAANELPDMWATHGWSVARYSEYLTPLEDQSWADLLATAIKSVITDKDGHIYVLPIDVDIAGVAYNKDVVAEAGVDVTTIKNWNDMFAAMEKVKAIGVTPVHMGGKDSWTIGNFFDWTAPCVYITDVNNYSGDDLKAGIFDTAKWEIVAGFMKELKDKGYVNVDVLTSTFGGSAQALGEGAAAFGFYGNYIVAEALTYAPDANLGFFPVPAYYDGDEVSLISGERTTIGIWKDTKYPEQCKRFLAYLAQPEVMGPIATSSGMAAGLTTATSDTGILGDSYELWGDVEAYNYFDREFLPSGMWDTMCSTGAGILSGDMTIKDSAKAMLRDFEQLYE